MTARLPMSACYANGWLMYAVRLKGLKMNPAMIKMHLTKKPLKNNRYKNIYPPIAGTIIPKTTGGSAGGFLSPLIKYKFSSLLIFNIMTNKQQEKLIVETDIGPIELPVDENWNEYTENERNFIAEVIRIHAESDPDSLNECVAEGINIRELTFFESLDEAKKTSNGVAVLAGDNGGQIYLTCPVKYVKCTEDVLKKLLSEIDDIEWGCNEGWGAKVDYRRANAGDGIIGGIGGGVVEDGLWIHPDIVNDKKELIKKVIDGELTSIS